MRVRLFRSPRRQPKFLTPSVTSWPEFRRLTPAGFPAFFCCRVDSRKGERWIQEEEAYPLTPIWDAAARLAREQGVGAVDQPFRRENEEIVLLRIYLAAYRFNGASGRMRLRPNRASPPAIRPQEI